MTTSPGDFIARGMAPEQAAEVATQIDETAASTSGYPDAKRMMGLGIAYPLATELAAQFTAGVGNATNLAGLGVPHFLADQIDAAIDAANA